MINTHSIDTIDGYWVILTKELGAVLEQPVLIAKVLGGHRYLDALEIVAAHRGYGQWAVVIDHHTDGLISGGPFNPHGRTNPTFANRTI